MNSVWELDYFASPLGFYVSPYNNKASQLHHGWLSPLITTGRRSPAAATSIDRQPSAITVTIL